MLRRALHMPRKGQKTFPPQFWKQLFMTAIREGTDLRMAGKAVDAEHKASPDMSRCILPHLSSHVAKLYLDKIAADDFASFYLESEPPDRQV